MTRTPFAPTFRRAPAVQHTALRPWRPTQVCAGALALLASCAHAQTTAPTEGHAAPVLGAVTVTGMPAADLATPLQIIDGTQWQLRRDSTLGASLGQELGIQSSHFGAGSSRPVVRGMDGARVGILSNGLALHDASTFSPDHAVDLDMLHVESVEVLRGPAALVHAGAIGGVINVVDRKIASAPLDQPIEADAAVQWRSNDHARHSSLGLSAQTGPLVWRVQAAQQEQDNYRPGGQWRSLDGTRDVPASDANQRSASFGLSWVGRDGYVGAAYSRQAHSYGLPFHAHSECHPHGSHLHCGSHDTHGHNNHGHSGHNAHAHATADTHSDHAAHDTGHDADHDSHDAHDHAHDHDAHGHPRIRMQSHRWDVRGEWRLQHAAVQAVRWQLSQTRYGHDELEGGHVSTHFRNHAHAARVELQHAPLAGWRGQLAFSHSQRDFAAEGAEAYVQPTDTRQQGLSWLATRSFGAWRWQAALRHDQQSVLAHTEGQRRTHQATSAALGTIWQLQPGWQLHANLSRAARLPSAEELFADGAHLATNSWEVGNPLLKPEISRGWELGLHKTTGPTTWQASVYHNRIDGYIFQRTVDAHDGFLLQHTAQSDARFTGFEAQVRHALTSHLGLGVFADGVRAKLADGGALARIPAGRWGVRADTQWRGWQGWAEWVHTRSQQRTAAYETATDGFGMLNVAASYQAPGSRLQWSVKATNLTDRLGYAHTSAIKPYAPLAGRQISVGLRVAL